MTTSLRFLAVAALLAASPVPTLSAAPEIVPLERKADIKAVYQVSDLAQHEGFSKGLFYARKVLKGYAAQGVSTSDIDLHLVFHSGAIPALLDDENYERLTGESGGNPNVELVAELVEAGVDLEICGDTMRQREVTHEQLLPGVKIVPGAFPRLIDLQLAGYAYIKFE